VTNPSPNFIACSKTSGTYEGSVNLISANGGGYKRNSHGLKSSVIALKIYRCTPITMQFHNLPNVFPGLYICITGISRYSGGVNLMLKRVRSGFTGPYLHGVSRADNLQWQLCTRGFDPFFLAGAFVLKNHFLSYLSIVVQGMWIYPPTPVINTVHRIVSRTGDERASDSCACISSLPQQISRTRGTHPESKTTHSLFRLCSVLRPSMR